MSHYKKIKTELKDGDSLMAALRDLDLEPITGSLTTNTLTITNHWRATSQVAIAVSEDVLARKISTTFSSQYGALGFFWNGNTYDLVQDSFDERRHAPLVNQIKQRYALHEVRKQAARRGYTLQELAFEDGTIQIVLRRY